MSKGALYLMLTCVTEVIWVYGFNVSSNLFHWMITIFFVIYGFYVLGKACQYMQTGTVYASFAGIGTVGAVLLDYFVFDESLNLTELIFISITILGVILLNYADNVENKKSADNIENKKIAIGVES